MIKHRGVAQLVAHLVWDQVVARSSRVTPTFFITRNNRRDTKAQNLFELLNERLAAEKKKARNSLYL